MRDKEEVDSFRDRVDGGVREDSVEDFLSSNPLIDWSRVEYRKYQIDIARSSIDKNTLVILPTALGKTMIAVYVSAHYLYMYPGKKILVLAPTKPLVNQLKEKFSSILRIEKNSTVVLTGELNPEDRMNLWISRNVRIFFATPEVVKNDLERGLSLEDFSLVIFDEAHRARGEYSYTKIAQAYFSHTSKPRILALTASPGADKEKVREIVEKLRIENVEYRSEYDEDVVEYVHGVEMEVKWVELSENYKKYLRILKESLHEYLSRLNEFYRLEKDIEKISKKDLVKIGEEISSKLKSREIKHKGYLWNALILQSISLIIYHIIELLTSQGTYTLKRFLEDIDKENRQAYKKLNNDKRFRILLESLKENLEEHPKLKILLDELERELKNNSSSRIIVFTQYRDTAEYLMKILREKNMRAHIFIGHRSGSSLHMSQKQQLEILKMFREGFIQVLIATSIGEEGIDIPQCNLVIFYEPIPSEIRFIQRKGRTGRIKPGRCLILVTRGTIEEAYLRKAFRKIKNLRRTVKELSNELKHDRIINYMEDNMEELKELEKNKQRSFVKGKVGCEGDASIGGRGQTLSLDSFLKEKSIQHQHVSLGKLAKKLYEIVLTYGEKGVNSDFLIEELKNCGYEEKHVKKVLRRLLKAKKLHKEHGLIFPFVKLKYEKSRLAGEDSLRKYKIFVEKILQGRAVVIVNDKWRAVVSSEMNDEMIPLKKGSEYIIVGRLLQVNGKLHLRLYGILRKL
ncbi:MAG: helicase-related protein [Nitrososphaerota archaeon]